MTDRKFPGATWTSSHVYGQGLINRARGLTYYNTPKCASMWMRAYIEVLGTNKDDVWHSHSFVDEDTSAYRPIVLVRDPVERWLSHCPLAEFLPGAIDNPGVIGSVFANFSDLLKDEHSAPQYDFIDGLDLTNAVYFMCDRTLSDRLNRFFDSQGFAKVTPPGPVNEAGVQENIESITRSKAIWRQLLANPEYFAIFQQAFARDYELINSVQFYQ
jgi:hypothetical protein